MVEDDIDRRDCEPAREEPLEADGHVAQPHGAVAVVEQRSRDDADGIGEVHDPGVRRRASPRRPRDLEGDGDGAQGLGKAAGTGRLLPDTSASQREGLVARTRPLAADPELQEHDGRAVERRLPIAGLNQPDR